MRPPLDSPGKSTTNEKEQGRRFTVSSWGVDSVAVAAGKGDPWDSGELHSDLNLVQYNGTLLKPFALYFWTVEGKDATGVSYERASVAAFETGMMDTKWGDVDFGWTWD